MQLINKGDTPVSLNINIKDSKAETIVMDAKLKATKNKISLSAVTIALLDKWTNGEIEIEIKGERK